MNESGNLFKTTLRLNLNNAQDLEAWNNLICADTRRPEYSSYTRTIVTAINDHFARINHPEMRFQETDLLQKIDTTVRKAVVDSLKEIPFSEVGMTRQVSDSQAKPKINSESEAAIEAFLDCF